MASFIFTSSKRKLRVFSTWLAIVAMLAQALVPVGGALASTVDGNAEKIFVCTASGIQTITINADGAPVTPPNQEPCPFCVIHATALPAEQSLDVIEVAFFTKVISFSWSPIHHDPATIWRATPGPSRAPPSYS